MVAIAETPIKVKERFRVLCSQHFEPIMDLVEWEKTGHHRLDPDRLKKYVKGDIVESTRDLAARFENKFQKLTEEEQQAPVDMEARKLNVDRLISGGSWKEEDRRFLMHLSDENYNRLVNRFTEAVATKPTEDKANSILGEDVTSVFQVAYDEGYKVFKNAQGKFQVTTKLESNKPLNRDPLAKAEVDKFVVQYIKDLKG